MDFVDITKKEVFTDEISQDSYVMGVQDGKLYRFPTKPLLNKSEFILEWHDGTDLNGVVHPTEEEKQANIEVIKKLWDSEVGSYPLYLKVGGRLLPACSIMKGLYSFIDSSASDGTFPVYSISYSEGTLPSGEVKKTYSQDSGNHVETDFDENSYAAPSMIAVADYVEQKLSAALNIDSEALI